MTTAASAAAPYRRRNTMSVLSGVDTSRYRLTLEDEREARQRAISDAFNEALADDYGGSSVGAKLRRRSRNDMNLLVVRHLVWQERDAKESREREEWARREAQKKAEEAKRLEEQQYKGSVHCLPEELMLAIFGLLELEELAFSVLPVCTRWRRLGRDESLWAHATLRYDPLSESPHAFIRALMVAPMIGSVEYISDGKTTREDIAEALAKVRSWQIGMPARQVAEAPPLVPDQQRPAQHPGPAVGAPGTPRALPAGHESAQLHQRHAQPQDPRPAWGDLFRLRAAAENGFGLPWPHGSGPGRAPLQRLLQAGRVHLGGGARSRRPPHRAQAAAQLDQREGAGRRGRVQAAQGAGHLDHAAHHVRGAVRRAGRLGAARVADLAQLRRVAGQGRAGALRAALGALRGAARVPPRRLHRHGRRPGAGHRAPRPRPAQPLAAPLRAERARHGRDPGARQPAAHPGPLQELQLRARPPRHDPRAPARPARAGHPRLLGRPHRRPGGVGNGPGGDAQPQDPLRLTRPAHFPTKRLSRTHNFQEI